MKCEDQKERQGSACQRGYIVCHGVTGREGTGRFPGSVVACDRILGNTDLCTMYEPGDYRFCMGIYRPEKRYPRILAEEFFLFVPEIRLSVQGDGSFFYLKKRENCRTEQLWYRRADGWKQAEREKEEFRIPSAALVYTMSPLSFVTEGDLLMAFPADGTGPAEENCRELNVHIW